MKYVNLSHKGHYANAYAFYIDPGDFEPLRLRDRYANLACAVCGKFDGYDALRLGVDALVRVRSQKDLTKTPDDCFNVSENFKRTVEKIGIIGLEFIPEVRGKRYFLLPTLVVEVDLATSGLKYLYSPCPECGKHRETIGYASTASMQKPSHPLAAFSPSLRPEKMKPTSSIIHLSEQAASLLRSAGLTGIDWVGTERRRLPNGDWCDW